MRITSRSCACFKLWVRSGCVQIAMFCLKLIFLNNSRIPSGTRALPGCSVYSRDVSVEDQF